MEQNRVAVYVLKLIDQEEENTFVKTYIFESSVAFISPKIKRKINKYLYRGVMQMLQQHIQLPTCTVNKIKTC